MRAIAAPGKKRRSTVSNGSEVDTEEASEDEASVEDEDEEGSDGDADGSQTEQHREQHVPRPASQLRDPVVEARDDIVRVEPVDETMFSSWEELQGYIDVHGNRTYQVRMYVWITLKYRL